ncbi:hypothetical protein OIU83_22145 [Flavobacterium sp. LS1R49]|uniref:Uncharacterized protein n=1 Tax=Flavobacterium shii TaxID=2987687 RepID=A0A9X2ZKK1_9FLAO|nr:hypothetical protein [Flavobacterium shii]MCV9930377.1 hypothetical protein [Flavobacterium shii]
MFTNILRALEVIYAKVLNIIWVVRKFKYILFFALAFFCICQIKAQIIREIPSYSLNDIACASFDNYGPVIYFNPTICQQAGELTTLFFKAHEYGHHNLGHVIQKIWNSQNPYVQQWLDITMENEADAYAVRYWVTQNNITIIQAWVNTMWMYNNIGDSTHLPSKVRAENVVQYYYQLTGLRLF